MQKGFLHIKGGRGETESRFHTQFCLKNDSFNEELRQLFCRAASQRGGSLAREQGRLDPEETCWRRINLDIIVEREASLVFEDKTKFNLIFELNLKMD